MGGMSGKWALNSSGGELGENCIKLRRSQQGVYKYLLHALMGQQCSRLKTQGESCFSLLFSRIEILPYTAHLSLVGHAGLWAS
jgi:hypothetical protein